MLQLLLCGFLQSNYRPIASQNNVVQYFVILRAPFSEQKCVRRNIPIKTFKNIENDDGWRCFVCDTNPLWSLRTLCDAAKRYVNSDLCPER